MRERDGVWPDSDREADIERQQLLRRIVLCRNAEMIEDARGIVDRDCLYELLQYYWKLNTWERKCCLVDLIQDQLRLRQGMSDPDIEKVAVDVLRAPGWGMDHIDYPKIWAMTFLTDRDYFEIEREELYADAEKELGKRGLELAGPRAPLIEAILKGRLDDALALLREGADPNVKRDTDGRCALQWAVIYGMVDLVKTLLDLGADPNARDAWDRTPLMEAVPSHKSEIVRLLLARGADPHAVDKIGWTALSRARSAAKANVKGATEIEQILLEVGAKR
jgi:hypothetical protein